MKQRRIIKYTFCIFLRRFFININKIKNFTLIIYLIHKDVMFRGNSLKTIDVIGGQIYLALALKLLFCFYTLEVLSVDFFYLFPFQRIFFTLHNKLLTALCFTEKALKKSYQVKFSLEFSRTITYTSRGGLSKPGLS